MATRGENCTKDRDDWRVLIGGLCPRRAIGNDDDDDDEDDDDDDDYMINCLLTDELGGTGQENILILPSTQPISAYELKD